MQKPIKQDSAYNKNLDQTCLHCLQISATVAMCFQYSALYRTCVSGTKLNNCYVVWFVHVADHRI